MSTENFSVWVQHLHKEFKRPILGSRHETFKGLFVRLLQGQLRWRRPEPIGALRDVSFEMQRGQTLGIVGSNGSGKSTLLKILAGLIRPTSGKVQVNGRVSALIELGAGFHPEISGRENIFINGAVLGLTRKQIRERFDEIVAFAELEDFIDMPVKTYSSGMFMRLGFSVAIHVDPDVLLIDEVLAVGDESFVHKCFEAIADFKRRGKTIVMVTHDLSMVERFCDAAIWIERGEFKLSGFPRKVIDAYLTDVHARQEQRYQEIQDKSRAAHEAEVQSLLEESSEAETPEAPAIPNAPGTEAPAEAPADPPPTADAETTATTTAQPSERWGTKDAFFVSGEVQGVDGTERYVFEQHEDIVVELHFAAKQALGDIAFGLGIFNQDGVHVFGTNTTIDKVPLNVKKGMGRVRILLPRVALLPGTYHLDCAIHTHEGHPYDYIRRMHCISIHSKYGAYGIYAPEHSWEFSGVAEERRTNDG